MLMDYEDIARQELEEAQWQEGADDHEEEENQNDEGDNDEEGEQDVDSDNHDIPTAADPPPTAQEASSSRPPFKDCYLFRFPNPIPPNSHALPE